MSGRFSVSMKYGKLQYKRKKSNTLMPLEYINLECIVVNIKFYITSVFQ